MHLQEPSTCHYMLTVAVPGLCQLPTFHQEAEPITHITCKPVLGLTLTESSADSDSQQQQQHQDVSHDDLSDTDSELGTNTTEQVWFPNNMQLTLVPVSMFLCSSISVMLADLLVSTTVKAASYRLGNQKSICFQSGVYYAQE